MGSSSSSHCTQDAQYRADTEFKPVKCSEYGSAHAMANYQQRNPFVPICAVRYHSQERLLCELGIRRAKVCSTFNKFKQITKQEPEKARPCYL